MTEQQPGGGHGPAPSGRAGGGGSGGGVGGDGGAVLGRGGRERALGHLGGAQHGLVTWEQLRSAGWSDGAIRRSVGDGHLVRVRRRVLGVAGAPTCWESAALAAVLAAGPGAVASHQTSARLWGLAEPGDRAWSDALHVTGTDQPRLAGVVGHRWGGREGTVAWRHDVPVTTVGRTLLDLAPDLGAEGVGPILDEALRRGLLRLPALRRAVGRLAPGGGRPAAGAAVLRGLLADRPAGWDPGASGWERDMDDAWDRWGLPAAARQHWVDTPGGRYRPDRAIVALRIAVDWNGYDHHGRRSRFDRDSDRRGDLLAARWLPIDVTSRTSPERVCRTVLAACEQQSVALGVPVPPPARRPRGDVGGGGRRTRR